MREKRVNLKIPAYVRETLAALETEGHQAYCVGGCVRDSLLGRMPEDWDVTTSALPEETMKVFGNRAIPTGLKHGTVTVCCQEAKWRPLPSAGMALTPTTVIRNRSRLPLI